MSSNHSDLSTTIRVDNLSKRYRLRANQGSLRTALINKFQRGMSREQQDAQELWALKGVSFKVKAGESLGIAGPNGAGKTTILKILSRVTRPTNGSIEVEGRLGALLELGAGFHPELTGRENVFLYGSILGLTRREIIQKFDQIIDFSGLERFIDTPVKRYSSGMYVRLSFSVAAHTDPDVLLVDEVLAVGDAQFRQKCIQQIKKLQKKGVSIVFISHNLFQMQAVCQRGILLIAGEVQVDDTIEEAVSAYEKWQYNNPNHGSAGDKFEFSPGQGGEDLRILGLEVRDLDGIPREQYEYQEGVEVRVHYAANHIFRGLNFVLNIKRMDGVLCSSVRSSQLGLRVGDIEGKGYISIRLAELQLSSGAYLFEIRMRDAEDAVTLSKGSTVAIQVSGPGMGSEHGSGIFLPHILDVSNNSQSYSLVEVNAQNKEEGYAT